MFRISLSSAWVAETGTAKLQKILLSAAFLNFFIVACVGVLLRAVPFLEHLPLSYKNMLHGHSHFAFGGWIMPAIMALVLRCFPELAEKVAVVHWQRVAALLLFSAYGMLISFSMQGYQGVSISFSTLSILAAYYFAFLLWKALKGMPPRSSYSFLRMGLLCMVLSTIGPFATGPLIAIGKMGTPIYYDVIYFYLHFQYNGWFVFAAMAFFYRLLEEQDKKNSGTKVCWLLTLACVPTYFLSVLWHQPSILFNIIAGVGSFVQGVALFFLLKDARTIVFKNKGVAFFFFTSFAALTLKILLQLVSALPSIASLAYLQRNFVIAYLHLVLLGFISLFFIFVAIEIFEIRFTRLLKVALLIFVAAFVVTETLLIANPLAAMNGLFFSSYPFLLLMFSFLLPISVGLIGKSICKGIHCSDFNPLKFPEQQWLK